MSVVPAATEVLVRPASSASGFEVLCVHRSPGLRFLGDFWVFPGGRVDAADGDPAAACARETLEETGLLPGHPAAPARLDDLRRRLLADELDLDGVLAELGAERAAVCGRLTAAHRWLTPPFTPQRFDTRFFLSLLPPGDPHQPRVVPGELDAAAWLDPAELLRRWREDEALLAPPTRVTLETLAATPASGAPDAAWLERARAALLEAAPAAGEWPWGIDYRPGLAVFPVRTPTLPPATHTNCYVVGCGRELVVVDPASPYPEERARLDAYLDRLAAGGQRVREVVLTHHHHDHVSGAAHLAQRLDVPIAAHRRTREVLQGTLQVTRDIEDGELLELPADLPGDLSGGGGRPRRLRALLTEGHADGHLVLHEETSGGVIAGDMVAGVGTIVIDPPEGRMSDYLASLRQLIALAPDVLYPAHGPPIGDPVAYLEYYVAHRLEREAKVLAAVEAGAGEVEVLVPRAYAEVPAQLYPLAARSLLAHLLKLEADGAVRREGQAWALCEAAP